MFDRIFGRKTAPPAGPDGTGGKDQMMYEPGDGATHTGSSPFRNAPSRNMRAFEDLEAPGSTPVLVDPRHNLYMPSRFAQGWFGGLIPNQPLPDWSVISASNIDRFHAPLTDVQVKDRESRAERGRGRLFPTAVVNPPQYLRHGGVAPIGIGPAQVDQFKATTDSFSPAVGNGPGSTWVNPTFMGSGFSAET